jgi:hypothetical protein
MFGIDVKYIDHLQRANADDLAFYPLTALERALDDGLIMWCEDNDEPAGAWRRIFVEFPYYAPAVEIVLVFLVLRPSLQRPRRLAFNLSPARSRVAFLRRFGEDSCGRIGFLSRVAFLRRFGEDSCGRIGFLSRVAFLRRLGEDSCD